MEEPDMRNPTEWRNKFERYKNGESVRDIFFGGTLPAYEDGKSPGEPEEDPYQVLQRYKGTSHDLFKDSTEFTDSDFDVLMNMWGLAEEQDVKKYFHSYVNSPGFDRIQKNQRSWWEKRHPRRKILPFLFYNDSSGQLKERVNDHWDDTKVFSMDMHSAQSVYKPWTDNAYVGRYTSNIGGNTNLFQEALGHEYAHGMQGWTPYKGIQEEVLNQNTNTNLSDDPGTNKHDSDNGEKHADIWGLKYLLFKEGIYDSRQRKNALPEHIQKLRLKYPKLRPLRQMDDKKAAWMLNHVAKNTTNYDSIT